MKTFDGADAVHQALCPDHPDKYVSLLWLLLNDKCTGINDIGRGRQDARGTEKEGGSGETWTEGIKDGRKKGRGERQKEGVGEESQLAPLNRPTELPSC